MKKNALYILFLLGFLASLVSCQDDNIIDDNFDPSLEGTSEVSFNLEFKPLTPALESRTAGDAIKDINDLNIVIYKADNTNEPYDHLYLTAEGSDFSTEESDTDPSYDGNDLGDGKAESTTCRASFKHVLPYGQYKIIAVANYGKKIATTDKGVTETDDNYNGELSESEIRNIQLNWDEKATSNNAEMFGFFSTSTNYKDVIGTTDITETVQISSKTYQLHAWLKRAASKVTVAYDGSKLNENVYITIKSVQIKDIPSNCKLGVDYGVLDKKGLITEGEKIVYTSSDNDSGPVITKGGVTWGSTHIEGWKESYDPKGTNGEAHTETSEAMFFYENLQGKGETGMATDKSVNSLIYGDKGKQLGTYIEVIADYENKNEGNVSSGEIIYRFMLGKDVKTDYNAERNCHYKVTLCFKNDANDPDWRIDYDEDEGIYVPNPYYISYLYNQEMKMPLKVVIGKDDKITSLKAEIIENNWEPEGDASALGDNYYGNVSGNTTYSAKGKDNVEVNGTIGMGNTQVKWLGFLSLKDEYKLNDNKIYLLNQYGEDYGESIGEYIISNSPYRWWTEKKLGVNEYNNGTEENKTGTDTKSVKYSIPFYTRVKQLYKVSGFTGNNPYVGYERTAKVKFTAQTKNGKKYEETVKIIQVKRLVNPTGIWRDKNNTKSFNVVLKEQSGYGGNFEDLISDGPWSATIKACSTSEPWFTLSQTSGVTGTRVAFTYTPKGKTKTPRCGIIEVKYHNNTCTHLIFVRQGYEPIAIYNGEAKWHSFNMKTEKEMATSPLDEGSLYRYDKWDYPIAEENNYSGLGYGVNPGGKKFKLQGSNDTKSWSEISSGSKGALGSPIEKTSVASVDDWMSLKNGKQGYGVLYADDATEVAKTAEDAFEYRAAITDDTGKKRGMKGVFAYNESTGANVFFPIGASGHGHRKQQYADGDYGVLRYGTVNVPLTTNANYRPMLYSLYRQNGAIYWTNSSNGDGWDINFDQLDFNTYLSDNAWYDGKSDACFVRLVESK